MAQHLGFISLESIIMDYIDESEQSLNKYSKLFNLAVRATDELGIDYFYKVQAVKLPVLPNLTVPLPANYINYSRVGVLDDRGELISLFQNNNLTTYADLLPNRLQVTQDDTLFDPAIYQTPLFLNYWNGYAGIPAMYGVPSGEAFVGSYKIDQSNGVILLSETFTYPYIILEYIAAPDESQPYSVPLIFREAIVSYLRWKDQISTPVKTHVMNSNIQMRRHDYYNDRRIALARWKQFDLDDAYQRSVRDTRLTVKV